ncbi:MAG: LysR substrate-binding domain-containing protein [Ottowia sp.]|uniref:LysR substrate-binding domain-containing protein n=1 Tax=unclassified Ottowia TaxID=2645081 RepID=UPI003C2BB42A
MDIKSLDLNLLRLFDAVWRLRNVSRAAVELGLSQPAASQGLARLRRHLGDALFVRTGVGVAPTRRAELLAVAVQAALGTLEQALSTTEFEPGSSRRVFRLHLSDIGEARFLPRLVAMIEAEAPMARIETRPLPPEDIVPALDSGRLDVAIGYLPAIVTETLSVPLIQDHYVILLRRGHPILRAWKQRQPGSDVELLSRLRYASVRSHADTLRILNLLGLESSVRLTAANFLSLPGTVKATDLAVLMPREIAEKFLTGQDYAMIEPELPKRQFTVSLHWSRRFDREPALSWLRKGIVDMFQDEVEAHPDGL